jgi:hypothetical protein
MGVYEGRGALARAMKDLMLRWADTKAVWRDAVAQEFAEQHLAPLEREIRNATSAMDTMAQILAQVNRDCR